MVGATVGDWRGLGCGTSVGGVLRSGGRRGVEASARSRSMLSLSLAFSMSMGAGPSTLSLLSQNEVAGVGIEGSFMWREGPESEDDRLEAALEVTG